MSAKLGGVANAGPGKPWTVHVVIDEWLPANEQAPGKARRLIEGLPGSAQSEPGIALVVSELVTNAVRHGRVRGSKRVRLRAEMVPRWTRIDVCDTGPGFMESFPARTEPGGWGLLLVSEVADRWGAARRAEHFCVWCEMGQARTRAPTPGVRPLVLVAEDEHAIAALLEIRLARLGCDVVIARDGQSALEKIDEIAPEMLVLDLRMPLVDGLTVLRSVRSRHDLRQPSVLLVSGTAGDADIDAGLQAGADGVVVKPFLGQTLDDEVARLLRAPVAA